MDSRWTHDFSNLQNAHQEIKDHIAEAQKVMELTSELNYVPYEILMKKVRGIERIFTDHSVFEETEIIPILYEMYQSIEIPEYIRGEHSYIRKEIQWLLDARGVAGENNTDLREGLLENIQGIFEEILAHLFEEEYGWYPLIQGYLNTKKEKNPCER